MDKRKEKEENKEAETNNEVYVVQPLEFCEPISLSELMKDKEEDKEVIFS